MQRILFLGTGNAFNTDGRYSQAIQVQPAGGAPFLVDVGPTTMAAMAKFAVDPDTLDRVFITHLHGDHIAGWPFLRLGLHYQSGRRRPLDIYGPAGTRQLLERLTAACYGDVFGDRPEVFDVRYHELPVEERAEYSAGEDLYFDVVPMDHHPSSIGYCFRSSGRSLGITGDTRWCANLERLAERSRILVLECTTLRKDSYAHVSLEEIRQSRPRLASDRIVLVHTSDAIVEALAREPIDGVVAAADGWELDASSL